MTQPASWPGLGFDPAPGDAARVAVLARQLGDAAKRLAESHQQLEQVRAGRGEWTGEAATAFAAQVGQLPRYLADARESMTRAGMVMGAWQGELADHQAAATDLERKAVTVRASIASAGRGEAQARGNSDFGLVNETFSAQDLPAAQARVNAAQAGLDQAVAMSRQLEGELQALLLQAQTLQDRHADGAGRAAAGVRAADDGLAPPEPSWLEEAWEWVGEHLQQIGDVAGAISAILGLIALAFPPVAVLALIAGGIALAAHGADMIANDGVGDRSAWMDLGLDAIGLIPGAGALTKLGRGVVDSVAEGARAAGATIRSGNGVAWAARAGGDAAGAEFFGNTVHDVADELTESTVFDKLTSWIGPQALVNLGLPADDPRLLRTLEGSKLLETVHASTVYGMTASGIRERYMDEDPAEAGAAVEEHAS